MRSSSAPASARTGVIMRFGMPWARVASLMHVELLMTRSIVGDHDR
jgi:hypothetical protein